MVRIRRSQIATADYNPRTISAAERSALRKGMKKFGLLQPLVWNERTGTLVGGHQRLAELDRQAEKGDDYELDVASVDLGDKEEREANILLNNFGAQGDWDLEKLKELARMPGFDPEAAGFEAVDLYRLLGEDEFAQVATAEQAAKVADVFDAAVKGRERHGEPDILALERSVVWGVRPKHLPKAHLPQRTHGHAAGLLGRFIHSDVPVGDERVDVASARFGHKGLE